MPRDTETAFDDFDIPPDPFAPGTGTKSRRSKASSANGKARDDDPGRGLPRIRVGGGSLPFNVDEAELILIERDAEVFQRGDFVVRPAREMIAIADQRQTRALRLVTVKVQHLIERFTRIIDFQRFDARSKKYVSINCPADIAAAYLQRVGNWRLPTLTGIVSAPTLRPDGSILDQPGYDTATGILYAPSIQYPSLPREPTQAQARAALDVLTGLISGFPFVDGDGTDATCKPSPSRSVALSAILTAIIRRSIPRAPMHAFTVPVMGSGKSKLVDIASMIATGHEAPVIAQGKTEEEMEKRLGAALLAGDALISFDNCEQPLGGELLCQALTQSTLKVRILGKSEQPTLPSNGMFCATGNNLVVAGDMTRRTIMATLDPKVERPETREFASDPIEVIRADRATYVAAAVVVLRAYVVAGMRQSAKPLGSFEGWSRIVRDALLWLGEPDPCKTMERTRADDPQTQALAEVLCQWETVIGNHEVSVKRVIEYAIEKDRPQANDPLNTSPPAFVNSDFREALLVVAGDHGTISSLRLGKWLARNKGRVIGGRRIVPGITLDHGVTRWRIGAP